MFIRYTVEGYAVKVYSTNKPMQQINNCLRRHLWQLIIDQFNTEPKPALLVKLAISRCHGRKSSLTRGNLIEFVREFHNEDDHKLGLRYHSCAIRIIKEMDCP